MSVTATVSRAASGVVADAHWQARRLWTSVMCFGARRTLREELAAERAWVGDADGRARTVYRAGQSGGRLVGVMLAITIAAAVGFIGTEVTSEIQSSITSKDLQATNDENQTVYENSSESLASGFADAMGLSDIAFLVLIFSVILGALLAFRRRRT